MTRVLETESAAPIESEGARPKVTVRLAWSTGVAASLGVLALWVARVALSVAESESDGVRAELVARLALSAAAAVSLEARPKVVVQVAISAGAALSLGLRALWITRLTESASVAVSDGALAEAVSLETASAGVTASEGPRFEVAARLTESAAAAVSEGLRVSVSVRETESAGVAESESARAELVSLEMLSAAATLSDTDRLIVCTSAATIVALIESVTTIGSAWKTLMPEQESVMATASEIERLYEVDLAATSEIAAASEMLAMLVNCVVVMNDELPTRNAIASVDPCPAPVRRHAQSKNRYSPLNVGVVNDADVAVATCCEAVVRFVNVVRFGGVVPDVICVGLDPSALALRHIL